MILRPERFIKDKNTAILKHFIALDDNDIFSAMKVWIDHDDKILSTLSSALLNRNLFKISIQDQPFDKTLVSKLREDICQKLGIENKNSSYFIDTQMITSNMYNATEDDQIQILMKNGETVDIATASDMLNIALLSKKTKKYFLWHIRSY